MATETEKLEFEVDQTEAGPKIELTPEQEAQYERITRNLQEVTSAEVLRKVIAEGKVPRAYWGGSHRREAKLGKADGRNGADWST